MKWLTTTLGTSIGKKLMMAATGLSFIGFLTVHLAGNLSLYGGADAFNSYAEHLHALGPLLGVAEFVLLGLFVIHVLSGLILFWQNFNARPSRYAVNRNPGGKTIGSATMPYTGLLILLFILFHLTNFSRFFVDQTGTTIFQIVSTAFQNPIYVGLYVLAMVTVALHVSHGFWSLFQTFGLNHPKYMPAINAGGLIISLVFGLGFGFLPIYISFIA
jgi:succinate dehydrogenase / fumarate reductase, cytochrome b subunit